MIIKRNSLGSLKAVIASAEADPGYAGSTVLNGTDDDGTPASVEIEFADESAT